VYSKGGPYETIREKSRRDVWKHSGHLVLPNNYLITTPLYNRQLNTRGYHSVNVNRMITPRTQLMSMSKVFNDVETVLRRLDM